MTQSTLRIEFAPLPSRPHALAHAELAGVFGGGCENQGGHCTQDCDCCGGPVALACSAQGTCYDSSPFTGH